MHPNLISLMLFCFVTSCTPGPNNILASYSSFNFGLKKTIPHMLGVALGYTSMITALDIGLVFPFKKYPIIQEVLKILGSLFLIYLAYKISFSKSNSGNLAGNPVKFLNSYRLKSYSEIKKIVLAKKRNKKVSGRISKYFCLNSKDTSKRIANYFHNYRSTKKKT